MWLWRCLGYRLSVSADNDGSELNLTKRQKTSVGEAFNSVGGDFTSDDSHTKEGIVVKIADITGMASTTDEERKWLINQLAATWKLNTQQPLTPKLHQ